MLHMSFEEFEDCVQQAIDALPGDFARYLQEVPVVIEDRPEEDLCREMKLPNTRSLLGLYHGLPLNRRSHLAPDYPSQIFLYRLNILEYCRSKAQVRLQIHKTLIHELGHYLGFSEQQLRDLKY